MERIVAQAAAESVSGRIRDAGARSTRAFVITNIGVIALRRTRPDLERGFRVPLVPLFPLIGAGLAIFLMKYLEPETWLRFGAWLLVGVVIYFACGRRHSLLRRGQVQNPESDLT